MHRNLERYLDLPVESRMSAAGDDAERSDAEERRRERR